MNGVGADPPVLLCGEHTHYAVTRAGAELGLGMRNVLPIRSRELQDGSRRAARSAARARSRRQDASWRSSRPLARPRPARSTISTRSRRICDEHGVWLHVDAAHGGSALLSERHRHRLRGIERARSIAWDPHKMMLLPIASRACCSCATSAISTRRSRSARRICFTTADGERVWDQGTRSFICSRRADVFKLWVALQRYGVDGLAELHDYFCALTRSMWEAIAERPDFEAMHEPESNILCFRYVGDRTRERRSARRAQSRAARALQSSGEGWITGDEPRRPPRAARDDDESAHDDAPTSATFSTGWRRSAGR